MGWEWMNVALVYHVCSSPKRFQSINLSDRVYMKINFTSTSSYLSLISLFLCLSLSLWSSFILIFSPIEGYYRASNWKVMWNIHSIDHGTGCTPSSEHCTVKYLFFTICISGLSPLVYSFQQYVSNITKLSFIWNMVVWSQKGINSVHNFMSKCPSGSKQMMFNELSLNESQYVSNIAFLHQLYII